MENCFADCSCTSITPNNNKKLSIAIIAPRFSFSISSGISLLHTNQLNCTRLVCGSKQSDNNFLKYPLYTILLFTFIQSMTFINTILFHIQQMFFFISSSTHSIYFITLHKTFISIQH